MSHLLYDGWHRPQLAGTHANKMFRALAPVLELAPWLKAGSAYFIPDWLPRAWEPFAMSIDAPPRAREPLITAYKFNRAARLVYWADRLDATAVSGDPEIAPHLRDIAMTTSDLHPTGFEAPFADEGWFSGEGTSVLPDLRLAFIRIMDRRTYRNGRPGQPWPLRGPVRFFVNDTVPTPASPDPMVAG
jgi:hypothetical protein